MIVYFPAHKLYSLIQSDSHFLTARIFFKFYKKIFTSIRFYAREEESGLARTFKDRYFMMPREYRKNGIDVLIENRLPAYMLHNTIYIYVDLSPQIVTVPETYIMRGHYKTTISGNESIAMLAGINGVKPASIWASVMALQSVKGFGIFRLSPLMT